MRKRQAATSKTGPNANRSNGMGGRSFAGTGTVATGLEHVHPSHVIALAAAANICAAMMIAIAPAIGFYIV